MEKLPSSLGNSSESSAKQSQTPAQTQGFSVACLRRIGGLILGYQRALLLPARWAGRRSPVLRRQQPVGDSAEGSLDSPDPLGSKEETRDELREKTITQSTNAAMARTAIDPNRH